MGEPSQSLDATSLLPAPWLVSYALALGSDFPQSFNPQDLDLLTCYAFNLAPPNSGKEIKLTLQKTPAGASLQFNGASPGVYFQTLVSTNLTAWSTGGVIGVLFIRMGKQQIRTLLTPPSRSCGWR